MEQIKIRLKNGYLVATKSLDPYYPGIDIEYVPDDDREENVSHPRILFEEPVDGKLRALYWNNPDEEDSTGEILFEKN